MVHYAGYTPRFHPSDFSHPQPTTASGADWPIDYDDLRPHYEQVERELPVAGQDWPWGYPHRYPFVAAPGLRGRREAAGEGAHACGIEMRVGPVGIVNGTFGNRPHCIYRGYCLQGCKVNAKASPYVTHLPDALAHGVEIRADCMALRVEIDDATGAGPRRHLRPTRASARAPAARPARRGRRLLHRDAAAAAQLDQPPLPARPGQQRRPGRPLRHGPGRRPDRGPVAGGAADVQGPAAGDLLRAVLRDRPRPRVRPRVLHPDGLAAADRLGRARARRRPLGPGAARVHARLQPLGHDRRAQRAAAAPGQPGHPRRRRPTRTAMPVARLDYTLQRQRQGQHGLLHRR